MVAFHTNVVALFGEDWSVSFAVMLLADSDSCCRQLWLATQMALSVVIGKFQQSYSHSQLCNHKTSPRINLLWDKMGP